MFEDVGRASCWFRQILSGADPQRSKNCSECYLLTENAILLPHFSHCNFQRSELCFRHCNTWQWESSKIPNIPTHTVMNMQNGGGTVKSKRLLSGLQPDITYLMLSPWWCNDWGGSPWCWKHCIMLTKWGCLSCRASPNMLTGWPLGHPVFWNGHPVMWLWPSSWKPCGAVFKR